MQQNRQRTGFLYRYYAEKYWYFESSELIRRLAVSAALFFFEPGRPIQQVFCQLVVAGYLVQMCTLQPYRGSHNNEFAIMCQLQLYITVTCGLMIHLEVPIFGDDDVKGDVQLDQTIISAVIIGTACTTLFYGVVVLLVEAVRSRDAWHAEQQRQKMHTYLTQASARAAELASESGKDMKDDGGLAAMIDDDDGLGEQDDEEENWLTEANALGVLKPLTAEQEEHIVRMFLDCDDNGSGTIEPDELREIAIQMEEPLSQTEIDEIFQLLDVEDTGSLEFVVFINWWKARVPERTRPIEPQADLASKTAFALAGTAGPSETAVLVTPPVTSEPLPVTVPEPVSVPVKAVETKEAEALIAPPEGGSEAASGEESGPKKKKKKIKKIKKKATSAALEPDTSVVVEAPAVVEVGVEDVAESAV
jgi:hypothetical protein